MGTTKDHSSELIEGKILALFFINKVRFVAFGELYKNNWRCIY